MVKKEAFGKDNRLRNDGEIEKFNTAVDALNFFMERRLVAC